MVGEGDGTVTQFCRAMNNFAGQQFTIAEQGVGV
jgi:hypothetical protein